MNRTSATFTPFLKESTQWLLSLYQQINLSVFRPIAEFLSRRCCNIPDIPDSLVVMHFNKDWYSKAERDRRRVSHSTGAGYSL